MSSSIGNQLKCPRCSRRYDVEMAEHAFTCAISKSKRAIIVFAVCPECKGDISRLSDRQVKEDMQRIVVNVCSDLTDLEWSITTDIALAAHKGCLVDALLKGFPLLIQLVFHAYNDRLIDDLFVYRSGGLNAFE